MLGQPDSQTVEIPTTWQSELVAGNLSGGAMCNLNADQYLPTYFISNNGKCYLAGISVAKKFGSQAEATLNMTVAKNASSKKEVEDYGFWSFRSFRFCLTMVLSLGILSMSTVRNALGMAMVCMINSTAVTEFTPKTARSDSVTPNQSTDQCPPETDAFLADYDGSLVWTPKEQGAVFSAIYWGGAIAGIPIGWLVNSFSPKRMIMVGFVILLASSLLSPVAAIRGGVVPTFVVRFVQGMVSQVLFTPSSTMILSFWVPMNERSTAMSLTTQGTQIAMVIGPPANAWLCQEKRIAGGWPAIFYANGFFLLLAAVGWWIFISDEPGQNRWISDREKCYIDKCLGNETKELKAALKSNFAIPWKQVWTSMCLWSCYICSFANGLMTATLTSYIPTYYKEVLHLDLTRSGLLSATPFLAQWIAKVSFSVTADLLKRRTKIKHDLIVKSFNNLGTFGVGIFLIAVGYTKCTQPILAVFFITMANALYSGLVPGYITSLVCIAPSLNGVVNGITRFAGQVASVIAPYIVGWLTANGGTAAEWRIVFYIMAGCMFLSGALFMVFGTAEIPDWTARAKEEACKHCGNAAVENGREKSEEALDKDYSNGQNAAARCNSDTSARAVTTDIRDCEAPSEGATEVLKCDKDLHE